MLRHVRRFSYAPPKGAGGSDNSSFFSLLGIAGAIGTNMCLWYAVFDVASGAAYVYYDPDVLPASVKKFLPIQEPQGHGMSLEEYEKWRAQQAGYPSGSTAEKKESVNVVESATNAKDDELKSEEAFLGKRRPIASESKATLEKLLVEARENEAGYLAELKKARAPLTEEDRLLVTLNALFVIAQSIVDSHEADVIVHSTQLQAFKDEKARLKKQIKLLNAMK